MAWTPRINFDIWEEISPRLYQLKISADGYATNNPLEAQIFSDIYKRIENGTETEKQREVFYRTMGIEESHDLTPQQYLHQVKTGVDVSGETGEEFLDYYPKLTESPSKQKFEHIYNNFMDEFLRSTNEEIFRILKKALDATDLPKSTLGEAINDIDQSIIYDMLGYEGLDSDDAMAVFATTLVQKIPFIDNKTRNDLENKIFEEFS